MNRKNQKTNIVFVAAWLLLGPCVSLSAAAPAWFVIQEKNATSMTLQIRVPSPRVDSIAAADGLIRTLRADDWPISSANGFPSLPFNNFLLSIPDTQARLTLLSVEPENSLKVSLSPGRSDRLAAEAAVEFSSSPAQANNPAASWAVLRQLGVSQGEPLWSLTITPFHYDPTNGLLTYISGLQVRIDVSGTNRDGSEMHVVDSATLSQRSSAVSRTRATIGRSQPISSLQGPLCKFYIDRDGLYRVTGADLRAAGQKLLAIDIKKLKLTCRGMPVPLFVSGWQDGQFDEQDYIEFWGQSRRQTYQSLSPDLYQDPFGTTAAYWLSWSGDRGVWMSQEQAGMINPQATDIQRPYSFYETLHIERDDFFERLRYVSRPDSMRDHWYYDTYLAAGRKYSFPFTLHHPDTRSSLPVQVRAMLCGITTVNPDPHQVTLFLNGRFLLKGTGYRQDMMDLHNSSDVFFSAAELWDGENTLTCVNDYDPEKSDYVVMNWFEVTYPRLYRANDNYIKFGIPPDFPVGRFQFRIDGFESADIDIYKLGVSKLTGGLTQQVKDFQGFESYQIGFEDQVQSQNAEYVAVTRAAKLKPVRMQVMSQLPALSEASVVDYLVIAPKKFMTSASLQNLLALRQSQGYRTGKMAITDIYDLFGDGQSSSGALKSFLQWAYNNWSVRYVLLLGDGCYVRKPVMGDTLDLIPVHFRQTINFGATVCDYWYGLVDGDDDLADIHIGRLPVRDEEQLKTIVDKITAYETQVEVGSWRNRLLFLGGEGQVFRTRGEQLAYEAPRAFSTSMLFTTRDESQTQDPFYGGTDELLDYFNQGCAVVNFHGHGGGAIWSDNGLLRLEDVERMDNRNRYPLVLSMTCYTGAFDDLANKNLSEVMLFAEDRGTIFFFGTSGSGWVDNDALLQEEIMNGLYQNPAGTIGEVIDAGKIRYYSRYRSDIAFSEINQYSLLGDPASRLKLPLPGVGVKLDQPLLQRGDTLRIHAALPHSQGSSVCEVVDSSLTILSQQSASYTGGQAAFQFVLPRTLHSPYGSVRVFGVDELGAEPFNGSARFTLAQVLFDSNRVELTVGDSLYFNLFLQSRAPLQRVVCVVQGDTVVMTSIAAGWYRTAWGRPAGDGIRYSFAAQTGDSQTISSDTFSYSRPGELRLEINPLNWRWGTDETLTLQVPVHNWSENQGRAAAYLELREGDDSWRRIAVDTVAVKPIDISWAEFPFSQAPGLYRVRVGLQSLQKTDATLSYEQMTLQVAASQVPAGGGFQLGDIRSDTLRMDDHGFLVSPYAPTQGKAVVSFRSSTVLLRNQSGLFAAEGIPAYDISMTIAAGQENVLQLGVRNPGSLSADGSAGRNYQLFRYVPRTRKWLHAVSRNEGGAWVTDIREDGLYTVLWSDDSEPPKVEMLADGVPLAANSYTGARPQVSVLIQDENGVDISAQSLQILLDGETVPEVWTLPDSIVDGNQIHLEGLAQLSAGVHQLTVRAADCIGNAIAPLEISFEVAARFEMTMLGNYPNPFKRQTTFAYSLTAPADRIALKIYSASGQLIRRMDGFNQEDAHPQGAGYHEWLWDGADEEGHQVANGVYFYRLSAEAGGKKHEITGKLARME